MPQKVVTDIVVPIISMKHAMLVGISTPCAGGWWDGAKTATFKGAPVLQIVTVSTSCKMCRERGTNPAHCRHEIQLSSRPPWSSSTKTLKIQVIIGLFANLMN